MVKKCILFLFSILIVKGAFGQKYEMKKVLSPDDKKELLDFGKQLFQPDPSIAISLSPNEAYKSFSSIPFPRKRITASFQSLKDSLSKDSLNAKWHFLFGEHYSDIGEITLSQKYYHQALDYLNMRDFKDSSEFLTLRGMIHFKLARLKDAKKDFIRSLSHNPNDTTAITFYMIQLFSSGQFTEIREICENDLNKETDQGQVTSSFCWLVAEELLSRLFQLMAEIDNKTASQKALQQMDYRDLFNFRLIDKYYKKFKNLPEIQNAKAIAEIDALVFKSTLLYCNDISSFHFDYPQNDLKRVLTLQKWLFAASNQLNEYSQNKYLGYTYLMQGNLDSARYYFNKAIAIFPYAKKSEIFNPDDISKTMGVIYLISGDTLNYRELLEKKINEQPPGKKSLEDNLNLAKYFFQSGAIEKAKFWCRKAKNIDPNNFETLRLLAHLYFLEGSIFMTKFYCEDMAKRISNPIQASEYLLQNALYEIYFEYPLNAAIDIKKAQQVLQDGNCELCDSLMTKYLTEVK